MRPFTCSQRLFAHFTGEITVFGENRVRRIDVATDAVVPGAIPVGTAPAGAALSPDGTKLYVTDSDGTTVSVIATATNTVTGTITVGRGPLSVAFGGTACPVVSPAPLEPAAAAPLTLQPLFTG